jgi:hypothetical protein
MILRISAADIDEGVPGDEWKCAIARSVRRQSGDSACVDEMGVVYATNFKLYPVGDEAADFVADFDNGVVLSPTALPYRTVRRAWE